MGIEIRKVAANVGPSGMTVFDPNFLRSGYCRKLYVATSPAYKQRTECHVHPAPHVVFVIEGANVRLATKESDGAICILKLEPCNYYYVPPDLPHQIDIQGRMVVETYTPSSFMISSMVDPEVGKKVLDEDLFETASSQDDSWKLGD